MTGRCGIIGSSIWCRGVCLVLLFAAVTVFGVSALAQRVLGEAEMVLRGKLIEPAIGQWATYSLVDNATKKTHLLRLSIVGEEQVGSETAWWVETSSWAAQGRGQTRVKKMLVVDDSSDVMNIRKMVFKIGYAPPYEAPVEPMQAAAKTDPQMRTVSTVGEETVNAAGTQFETKLVKAAIGEQQFELWTSPTLHLTGVVKAVCPTGTVTLVKWATEGARSAIQRMPDKQPGNIMKKQLSNQPEFGTMSGAR